MPDLGLSGEALAIVAAAFAVAGFVKGVFGGGLPAIAVPIMASVLSPALAAALTFVPVLLTNVWLVSQGGHLRHVLQRYWPLLAALALGSAIGSQIWVSAPPQTMKFVIGTLVIILSPLPFVPSTWAIPARVQPCLNPLAGLVMGIIGGATVMLAPVIVYFVALRIDKDLFVASMGAIALSSMTPLFIALTANRVLGPDELWLSALVFLPTALGMGTGIWLRRRLSQRGFQAILSVALLGIGVNLVRKSLGA